MYKVRLPNFEGPFDLLLYFIKRDDLNIYDIPIAKVTLDFLEYIRLMKIFDLELASEFILVASNLMYIKAQMLLPRPKDEDGEEIEDPRTGLVQQLLRYKQVKEGAGAISELMEGQKYTYYRNVFDADNDTAGGDAVYKNANMFDLLRAFKKALSKNTEEDYEHVITRVNVSVDEKIELIKNKLTVKPRVTFTEITGSGGRPHVVATFLAILDLIRSQVIFVHQDANFEEIIISLKPNLN